MANEATQQEIQLNTVYKINRTSNNYEGIRESLIAQGGGTVDVYIRATKPSSIAEMKEIKDKENIQVQPFATKHNYLYVEQNTSTVTGLFLVGIQATEVEV